MDFFGRGNGDSSKYRPVSHDSDSEDEGDDYIQQHLRTQQVSSDVDVSSGIVSIR